MTPLVFVHGTGVREPEFSATAAIVAEALAGHAEVRKCYWGERNGSRLSMDGASIPDYAPAAEDPPPEAADDAEIELWSLLGTDPLYEMRLLAAMPAASEAGFAIGPSPGQRLHAAAGRLAASSRLRELLARNGLDGSFDSVAPEIFGSDVFDSALARAGPSLVEHRYAVARALAAATVAEARRRGVRGGLPIGYEDRTELIESIVDELGGREYGLVRRTWRNVLLGLVKQWGNRYLARNRRAVADGTWPLAGDVLLYQARGDGIRAVIREHIVSAGDDPVVLAHSLGGVACVDLLIREALDVRLLITVGSQAPFLYEIGALSSLESGAPLPDHFPAWVNIYDRRDLLSYVGAAVFPERVEDVCVDNRVGFPDSHSAYWTNRAVIQKLRSLVSA